MRIQPFSIVFLCLIFISTLSAQDSNIRADQLFDSLRESPLELYNTSTERIDSTIQYFGQKEMECRAIQAKIWKAELLNRKLYFDQSLVILKDIIYEFPAECDSTLLLKSYKALSSIYIAVRNFEIVDSLYGTVQKNFSSEYLKGKAYHGLLLNLGQARARKGEFQSALEVFKRITSFPGPAQDSLILEKALHNLGSTFAMQGMLDSAEIYYKEALSIARKINLYDKLISLRINLANISSDRGQYDRAISMLDSALSMAREQNKIRRTGETHYNLSVVYDRMSNYELAYNHLEAYDDMRDSMLNAKKITAVAEAEHKYERERRKREIQELKVQNLNSKLERNKAERTRNYFILGGIIVLLIALGLWNRMRHIRKSRRKVERERDRSERLLLNILPSEIADELKKEGKYTARHHRQVSIMFADFKDFTQVSEQMKPEELVAEIDYCFKAFDEICSRHSLEKIKTIGDCYMVASGLPVKQEKDPENIVRAALDMQEFIRSRKTMRHNQGHIGFDMRVGIHSGPVVAGVVGSDKFSYDIWGDTVNTASRMESTGQVGKVNISRTTFELIEHCPDFTFEHRGKIHAKHKGEVEMYFVKQKQESELMPQST